MTYEVGTAAASWLIVNGRADTHALKFSLAGVPGQIVVVAAKI
jgi:hypothetical protein